MKNLMPKEEEIESKKERDDRLVAVENRDYQSRPCKRFIDDIFTK